MKKLKTRPQRRMRNRVYRSQTPHRGLSSLPQTEYARVAPPLGKREKESRKSSTQERERISFNYYQVTIKSPPRKGYSKLNKRKQQRNLTKASQLGLDQQKQKKEFPKRTFYIIYNNSLSLLSKTTPFTDRCDQAKQRKEVTTYLLTLINKKKKENSSNHKPMNWTMLPQWASSC